MGGSDNDAFSHPFVLGFATALAVGGLGFALGRTQGRMAAAVAKSASQPSSSGPAGIVRWQDSPRSCAVLQHQGVVYLSGQVGDLDKLEESDCEAQTRQTLAKIEKLLAEAGTNKEHILSSQIWVKDITKHFEPMNKVWNAWVHPTNKGVRACVEARLARPGLLVEVKVIAAVPQQQ